MTTRALQFGDVLTASFPQQNPQGREQEGCRPAIVVGFPNRLGIPRFSLIVVIPMKLIEAKHGQSLHQIYIHVLQQELLV
ncbi:hypothetical protein JYQ62_33115 [Nostoc sp. UHCC 0702]|nr:hypothetical protein JYQ62_33115 [Nostoc sp. UHCC 0702]